MLHQIGLRTGTDKVHHVFHGRSYCDIYERYFEPIRSQVKIVIEIGVKDGESVRMLEQYFPNAMIYGVDIDPRCKQFESNRVRVLIGDQNDESFLKEIRDTIGPYDILIDDGSHITDHQIKTFEILYPNLKQKGIYCIEDLRNSYEEILNVHDLRSIWSGMKYNQKSDPLKNYRQDFVNFIESQVKQLDFHEHPTLFAIHHYPMVIIFENA